MTKENYGKRGKCTKITDLSIERVCKKYRKKFLTFHYLLRKFQIKDPSRGDDGYKENVKENVVIYSCGFIFK